MVGLVPPAVPERGIEAILKRDRQIIGASLALVCAIAWLYLWRDAAAMSSMGMGGMAMPATTWDAGTFALCFVMWAVMMVGMMLPSAAPTILLYGAIVRKNGEQGTVLPAVWIFTSGYLTVWTAFSLVATLLQMLLEQAALMTPMMESASKPMDAAVLICAGIYQWLPLKDACLSLCRNPMQFLMTRWRSDRRGAFRMGANHGLFCLGCCWLLMLLLFVAGVMNLVWVALIAGFVLIEKLLPASAWTSRIAGLVLVTSGAIVLSGT